MASIKVFICEASASVKAKFDGTNLPTNELNNFIGEIFLFDKGNLIIENTSSNKHVFIAILHLDITDSSDAARLCHFKYFGNGPTERASDSLKTDVTKKLISQELKQILPSCKKHWKAYLILL